MGGQFTKKRTVVKERNKKFTCCKNTFPKFKVTHSSIKTFILSLMDISARKIKKKKKRNKTKKKKNGTHFSLKGL